jgi:PAS domain S-box-containing protein
MSDPANARSYSSRRLSIALLVIVALVVVASVLFSTLGVIAYGVDRDNQLERLHKTLAADADELAMGLSLPIWNFDRAQIDKILESIMKDEDVYGAVVEIADVRHSIQGITRDANWRPVTVDKRIPHEGMLSEQRAVSSPEELLGTVYVYSTPKFVEARIHRNLIAMIATIVSLGLILILSLYILLWRMVLKPLRELEQFAILASSESQPPVAFPIKPFRGELEGLRSSMESMVTQLQGRLKQLQQAENALRESEGLMKSLIQNLPLEFWAKDAEGRYILQNPASIKNWGNQIGKRMGEPIPPAELLTQWESINSRAMNGEVVRDEWRWTDAEGKLHIFSEVVAPIYEGRTIRGILGVNVEVTDERSAQAGLLTSEERFRLVTLGTNDGIWDWDLVTKKVYRSKRLKELLGYSEDELEQGTELFSELLHPQDKERVTQLLNDHLARRTAFDTEFRMRHKSGNYRWFRARGQAVWNADGAPTRIAGAVTDIDESKQSEEKLLRYQLQLQSLASRLVLAEESERRNFSRLLHDHIGQNLTYAKIRLGGALRIKSDANAVEESIREVLSVIEQMSAETRSLTYDLSPPLLYEIGLDAALEWLCEQFQKRYGLNCRLDAPTQSEELPTDVRVVLFQAARELLFNVVKHANAKSVTVTSSRNNGCMCLTIRDDGAGFNPSSTGSTRSGFGLFNVRERMKYMGGDCELLSEPGKGCTVSLILPFKRD